MLILATKMHLVHRHLHFSNSFQRSIQAPPFIIAFSLTDTLIISLNLRKLSFLHYPKCSCYWWTKLSIHMRPFIERGYLKHLWASSTFITCLMYQSSIHTKITCQIALLLRWNHIQHKYSTLDPLRWDLRWTESMDIRSTGDFKRSFIS